jgi:hypothetical protein
MLHELVLLLQEVAKPDPPQGQAVQIFAKDC